MLTIFRIKYLWQVGCIQCVQQLQAYVKELKRVKCANADMTPVSVCAVWTSFLSAWIRAPCFSLLVFLQSIPFSLEDLIRVSLG